MCSHLFSLLHRTQALLAVFWKFVYEQLKRDRTQGMLSAERCSRTWRVKQQRQLSKPSCLIAFLSIFSITLSHYKKNVLSLKCPGRFPSLSQQLYKCEVLFLKWEVVICPVRDIFWFSSFFPSLFCMTGFFLAMLPPHRGPPGLPQATQVLSLFRDMAPDSSADSFSSYLPQT